MNDSRDWGGVKHVVCGAEKEVNWRGHAAVLVHFMQLHGVVSILCHFDPESACGGWSPARACAEPNRKIRIWTDENDEGKSHFARSACSFAPAICRPGLILIRQWYCNILFINYIKYK